LPAQGFFSNTGGRKNSYWKLPAFLSGQRTHLQGVATDSIPYELRDYLELVDWTGRAIAPGKKGTIPESLPPILQRLKLNPDKYLRFIRRHQKSRFGNFIGPVGKMRELAEHFQQKFQRGQAVAARLFSPS